MAFGNITTLYLPTDANSGSSQWGTDVRKMLDTADTSGGSESGTNHGTGGATQRTFDPYSTTSADLDQTLYGWAVTPSDMNSVAGARRFYPGGDHTVTARFRHSGATAQTGTLYMYVYRVGPSPSRTRTLLGSNTGSVALPALAGTVSGSCTVALPEVIFEPDETIQYSFEFNVSGIIVTGETVFMNAGTFSGITSRIETPKLGVLADTTGSASGSGTADGVSGLVLGTEGTATGTGSASGSMSSTASTTGSASGTSTVDGLGSSVAGTTGTASGTGTAAGLASIVLGTVGTVNIGGGGADWPVVSPTKVVEGAVMHHETGLPVVGATVRLIRDSDGLLCQSDTSGVAGAYSFPRDTSDPYTYHVSADYDDSGTPIQGLTTRGLVPA